MIVISDTSPISGLIIIGKIDILFQLYNEIIVPQVVADELSQLTSHIKEVELFLSNSFLKIKKVSTNNFLIDLTKILDAGEAEAIIICQQLKGDLLLIDETKGLLIAKTIGLNVTGLLGILIEAKEKQIILSIKPLKNDLKEKANFWIGNELFNRILEIANEINEDL